MKKSKLFALALVFVLCLSACGNQKNNVKSTNTQNNTTNTNLDAVQDNNSQQSNDPTLENNPEDEQPKNVVSDFVAGEVEMHEDILPFDFEDGETIENRYYKRTTDENGDLAYAVKLASSGEVTYIPIDCTVVYLGDSGDCYYERTTNSYKLDGEPTSTVQYQLFVSNSLAESADTQRNDT